MELEFENELDKQVFLVNKENCLSLGRLGLEISRMLEVADKSFWAMQRMGR